MREQQVPIEGRTPGEFNIPGVGTREIRNWKEDVVYDNIELPVSISSGNNYEFFTNVVVGKSFLETNLDQSNRLPEGYEMEVRKMGLMLPPSISLDDAKDITENSYIEFITGRNNVRRKGPTWMWPCDGMGTVISHSTDYQTSVEIKNCTQIGVPSPSAVPPLLLPINLTHKLNFKMLLTFTEDTTLDSTTEVWFVLFGPLSGPVQ